VHLKAGASRAVTLEVDARAQSQVDAEGRRSVRSGTYTLHVGGGQPAFVKASTAQVVVTGEVALPK
jgi:beta-glucosidase